MDHKLNKNSEITSYSYMPPAFKEKVTVDS